MSAQRLRPPLVIRPRVSSLLAVYVGLSHGAAAAAVVPLPWPWPLRLALISLIAAHAGAIVWVRLLARAPWSIRVAVHGDAGWKVVLGDGRVKEARLASATYVGVRLVILSFRIDRRHRQSLVLLPDALEAPLLRRLRVRLRLDGNAQPPVPEPRRIVRLPALWRPRDPGSPRH
jgi:toxin CptA